MKYLSALLAGCTLFFAASNASAFDIKQGRWIAYVEVGEVEVGEVMTFYVNDKKDFKGYSYTGSGMFLRLTGNVNDGLKSKARIVIERRGRDFFNEAKGEIRGRAQRFTAFYKNAKVQAYRAGTSLKVAGAYEGFNSFGDNVLMVILPNGDVKMSFLSEDTEVLLTGKARGRKFTVRDEEGRIRLDITIAGNGVQFRGQGIINRKAFRAFGNALPETPEELAK